MPASIYEYKAAALQIGDVDKRQGIVTGYFSQFDNVDLDKDVIRKGAFARTIQETGPKAQRPRIKHLLNHSPMQSVGLLQELKEDNYGLYYESKIGTHNLGQDFIKMIESGLITEHSIGYVVTGKSKQPPKGVSREIIELKLFEGSSLTGWGVNEGTPLLSLKGVNYKGSIIDIEEETAQRIKALERFCRNSDATDETIELLLIEIKQLSQQLLSIATSSTQPADKAVEPPKGPEQKAVQEYDPDEVSALIQIQKQRLKLN